ncbi:MAG: hypothetical protein JNK37_19245 [Verrucomicrobiales bacterium]|nr:hypothetical protein [Verrucomicrobiales bacterium]
MAGRRGNPVGPKSRRSRAGHLETVASPDLGAVYAYHPGSSLIAGIEHTFGVGIGGSPVAP